MKVTYYAQSDILYIEFTEIPVAGPAKAIDNWTYITVNADGTPQSLEILNAAARGVTVNNLQTNYIKDETAISEESGL